MLGVNWFRSRWKRSILKIKQRANKQPGKFIFNLPTSDLKQMLQKTLNIRDDYYTKNLYKKLVYKFKSKA